MAGHGFLNKESHQIFQRASLIRNVALKQDTVLFLIKSNRRNGGRPRRTHAPVTKNIYTGKNQDPTLVPAPEMYFRNYTSNKVLDISIVIWKGKVIVIYRFVRFWRTMEEFRPTCLDRDLLAL